ncbi:MULTISPECIES: antirestriction protein ArdA [unclassified Lentilitoribacter]|uniref:antirestriction protein ArdA n=1 Tax=unclassified Lentilitoribacter TaxID=2647570 RepID=UPI0013A7065A|nr:antirestriction protein ArdA [Lentilitoribacter sp. Alg239-R112]
MTTYFAQSYDLHANGFYFDDGDEFREKFDKARNEFGDPVEEFEIQFIDGESIDARLFDVLSVGQGSIAAFIDALEQWREEDKVKLICAIGECGYDFEVGKDNLDRLDVDIYPNMNMCDLAEQFVDEGLFGEIPESIQCYLDFDAIARDLAMDYSEIEIGGERYVYRCA